MGNCVWNSGMFIWSTTAIMEAFEKYLPEMHAQLIEIQDAVGTENQEAVIEKVFQDMQRISIDYGVMEKADNVLCLRARFTWDDVGAWTALGRVSKVDLNNNLIKSEWKGIDNPQIFMLQLAELRKKYEANKNKINVGQWMNT